MSSGNHPGGPGLQDGLAATAGLTSVPGSRREGWGKFLFAACAWISAAAIALILVFLVVQSLPAFQEIGLGSLLFGTVWKPTEGRFGLLPMIAGTFAVTFAALAVAAPLGILCALYLAHFCPARLKPFMRTVVSVMAGIPSVVYGFFGLEVLVPWIRLNMGGTGTSLLCAAVLLGMMIVPTITELSLSSIETVDPGCYEGSLALGATPEHSGFFAVLPAARSGLATAVVLGLGRAVGETMAVMMVAGNQPLFPDSLLGGVRTLTANIAMEMGYAADLHRQALTASALVLLVIVLAVIAGLVWMRKRSANT
ncbi:phosphate ABC transporter permease subunit PstC [Faecalibaculum rodentium]|uniref:phosphate ABC transporter permease subunit PstC n=1 Tax=Faecalibaculum rodentium TaxID=1702221 RepID=UPI0023EFE5D2|nr:phosphate ABC transporter permease subunit PstC [Faecalibaculum rodentium]